MLKMKTVTDIVISLNRKTHIFTGTKYSNITHNVCSMNYKYKKTYLDQCDYTLLDSEIV